jgi:hypothetical protein
MVRAEHLHVIERSRPVLERRLGTGIGAVGGKIRTDRDARVRWRRHVTGRDQQGVIVAVLEEHAIARAEVVIEADVELIGALRDRGIVYEVAGGGGVGRVRQEAGEIQGCGIETRGGDTIAGESDALAAHDVGGIEDVHAERGEVAGQDRGAIGECGDRGDHRARLAQSDALIVAEKKTSCPCGSARRWCRRIRCGGTRDARRRRGC